MATEIELHPVQAQILKLLLFKPRARFAELNVTGIGNDHFTWHLKRLLELELLEKVDGHYRLTTKGKEFANRMDTDAVKIEKQAKTAALIGCTRMHEGKREYLFQQRLKQPYYGYHGFVTGKIRWGELVEEAGLRELKEETNLTGKIRFTGIEHKVDYDQEGKLLEDKFFYVMLVDEPQGELIETFEGGKNLWVPKDDVEKLPKLFPDVLDILELVEKRGVQFLEKRFVVGEY